MPDTVMARERDNPAPPPEGQDRAKLWTDPVPGDQIKQPISLASQTGGVRLFAIDHSLGTATAAG